MLMQLEYCGHLACLITRNLPNGIEFGIDFQSYRVGDQFLGISQIPPGPHFVFWSPRDSSGESSIRMGFLHYFRPGEVIERHWDAQDEELKELPIQDIAQVRQDLELRINLLAEYEQESINKWQKLTSTLTDNRIQDLNPAVGIIRPFGELISDPEFDRSKYQPIPGNTNSSTARKKQLDFLQLDDVSFPYLHPVRETIPNFTEVPDRCPVNSTAAEVTTHYMDCIDAVDKLFNSISSVDDLISEVQYAFAIFLIGHSIEGLLHWRKILLIMSNSNSSIAKYLDFYEKYFAVLKHQILELPEELMIANDRNMVYRDVRQLLINAGDCEKIRPVLDDFLGHMQNEMKWFLNEVDLNDEDPEDMPVVVEI